MGSLGVEAIAILHRIGIRVGLCFGRDAQQTNGTLDAKWGGFGCRLCSHAHGHLPRVLLVFAALSVREGQIVLLTYISILFLSSSGEGWRVTVQPRRTSIMAGTAWSWSVGKISS